VAVPEPISVVQFTPNNVWSFLEWKNQVAVRDGKVVLAGLTSKGICSGVLKRDLSSSADRSPAMRVHVLPGNTALKIGFRFVDAQANHALWMYTLPSPGDRAQLLLPDQPLPLSAPWLVEKGQGSFALDRITEWKLVGDWHPGTLAIEIEEVLLVAPDATMLAQRAAAVAKNEAEKAAKAAAKP
jgi:hypothetical protein